MLVSNIQSLEWKRAFSRARYLRPVWQHRSSYNNSQGWGGTFMVESTSKAKVEYTVTLARSNNLLFFECSCPAGQVDHPCVHVARVFMEDYELSKYYKNLKEGKTLDGE